MYGLPKDFDAASLIGLTLEMVCFNLSQIYLHFDRHARITVEGALLYRDTSNGSVQKVSPPVGGTNLMQLVGHKLTHAFGSSEGTLSLTFDNGHSIDCLDVSPDYESYQIICGGRTIIV